MRAPAARALGRDRHAEGRVQRPLPHLHRHGRRRVLARDRIALSRRLCGSLRKRHIPAQGDGRISRVRALRRGARGACAASRELGRSSMDLPFEIWREGPNASQAPLITADLVYVNADVATGKPAPLPEDCAHVCAPTSAWRPKPELAGWKCCTGRTSCRERSRSAAIRSREQEIVEFARQFDPQPFHTDPEAAQHSFFRGLIASGWHTCAVAMRLMVQQYIGRSASRARRAWTISAGSRRSGRRHHQVPARHPRIAAVRKQARPGAAAHPHGSVESARRDRDDDGRLGPVQAPARSARSIGARATQARSSSALTARWSDSSDQGGPRCTWAVSTSKPRT